MMKPVVAEFVGTMIFIFVIIKSGNALAIGATLALLIHVLGSVSGGNFNPAVTAAMTFLGKQSPKMLVPYVLAQVCGGLLAVVLTKVLRL